MKEDISYNDLILQLEDPKTPFFGGSLAYIEIEESLALLIKLLKIKSNKPSDQLDSYQKIIIIAQIVKTQSDEMINKDGEIFNNLRTASTQENKDKIVLELFSKSQALLENIDTLYLFVSALEDTAVSSIRYDYAMIKDSLRASYRNLLHILEYEVKKMSEGETKAKFLVIITGLQK